MLDRAPAMWLLALQGLGLMGLLYQQSGSYRWSYLMIGTVSLAGLIAVWWAGKPPVVEGR